MKFLMWFMVFVFVVATLGSVSGCANWSNHTTVLGVEAAWNPQSLIPTGRAGLIDHDNNGVSNDSEDIVAFVWKKYDGLNLWCLSGSAQTISYTGPVDSDLAKAAAEYIKVQTAAAKASAKSDAATSGGLPSVPTVPAVKTLELPNFRTLELPVQPVPSVAPK